MSKPDYDTTLARIAGNIAGAIHIHNQGTRYASEEDTARISVGIAKAIVARCRQLAVAADPQGK